MIVWFDDPSSDRLQLGGKALHLCRMVSAGLPVPAGFCVTADSIAAIDIDDLAPALNRLSVPSIAVRSSAIDEDSSAASFAGIYRTHLNLKTPEEVVHALRDIERCASSPSAATYRAQRGLSQTAAIAAVVQSFVAADVSGVVFTRHPVYGTDRIVIEASWGLGEAVVGGLVTPDHWELSPEGEILDARIADKDVVVVPAATGVRRAEVEPHRRRQPCLKPQKLHDLVRLGRVCQGLFGSPQDIEWAIDGANIWLLQSRPITAGSRHKSSDKLA
jgi:pyruvate,water dikinase